MDYEHIFEKFEPTEAELLGVDEERLRDLREWGYKAQDHYSLETRQRLAKFQIAYKYYVMLLKINGQETRQRSILAQELWEELLRARKKETGVGYYLDAQEYAQKQHEHTGRPSNHRNRN